jgi:PAS domain S-box-containing protein
MKMLKTRPVMEEEEARKMELLKISQAINLIGSWEWDLSDNRIFWTDGMFQLRATPTTVDHLITFEETLKFIHEDDVHMVLQRFKDLEQKKEVAFHYRVITDQGETKYIKAWAEMVRDEEGKPALIRGTSQDVTKELEMEKQLLQLNEVFQQAEELACMGNWQVYTAQQKIICSSSLYTIFGCRPLEVEPTWANLIKFIHPDDVEKVLQIKSSFKNRQHGAVECRIIKKDGEERYIRSIVKWFNTGEPSEKVIGTIQDITRENDLQTQLEEEKQFAQMLFDNSVDLVAAFDINCKIIAWNKACEDIVQVKRNEVIGKHYAEVFPGKENEARAEHIQKALTGVRVHRPEEKLSFSKGYYEEFFLPLKRANGEIFGVVTISHDITERKMYADTLSEFNHFLEHKNKELERSNNELASFSYVASHDLQEPLRKIQTFSNRLRETELSALSAQGQDYFKRMEQAAARMQKLIEDLLSFSRTNVATPVFEEVDLNKLVKNIITSLKDSIEEKQAAVKYSSLPKVKVIPFQFQQLLENLILNSLKYSKPDEQPKIDVEAKLIKGREANIAGLITEKQYYQISVTDNGIGFEQQYAEKIFELFQRLHGKHEFPGTGLGLAICKKVIENHQGYIYANSTINKGATFTILLPV